MNRLVQSGTKPSRQDCDFRTIFKYDHVSDDPPQVVRTCDGSHNDDTLQAVFRRLLDVLQQQIGQQKMAKVICGHAQLIAIGCVARLLSCGQIHRSIADQHVQPPLTVPEVLQPISGLHFHSVSIIVPYIVTEAGMKDIGMHTHRSPAPLMISALSMHENAHARHSGHWPSNATAQAYSVHATKACQQQQTSTNWRTLSKAARSRCMMV